MLYKNYLFNYINKKIKLGLNSRSGRNFSGRICVHHKINKKNKYFKIDFYRRLNCFGFLYKIIKNSNRSSFIGGIIYENGLFSYIILTEKIYIGSKIYSGIFNNNKNLGWSYKLENINLFTIISNIELNPYNGINLVRAAGTKAILTKIEKNKVNLKLKSGWNLIISNKCLGIFGRVSNKIHKLENINKAGKNRALGKRPTVRGVAMNPCDHPHGGGEGKKSPPSAQKSPWGWLTKGTPSKIKLYDKIKKKIYKSIKK